MIRYSFFACVFSLAFVPTVSADTWYYDISLTQLNYSMGADGIHVSYSGDGGFPASPENCDSSDKFIVPYPSDVIPEREKGLITGLSMAFAASKKVDIMVRDCMSGIGGVTYPKVWYLFVKQ